MKILKTSWISILCAQLIFSLPVNSKAQLMSSNNSAFLEYVDKNPGPSDYIIKRFPNQKLISARLIGGVQKPGFYQIPENTSLLTLMSYSGGAVSNADMKTVRILREQSKESYEIDVEALIREPSLKDPSILSNDVIYIKQKSPLINQDSLTVILVISTIAATILTTLAIQDRLQK